MSRAALAIALFLVAAPAVADEAHPYVNERWGFTAIFPWAASEKPQPQGGVMVAAGNPEDTISYMISVSDIDAEVMTKGNDSILEAAVQGSLSNIKGGSISGKKTVSLGKFPGREFVVTAEGFAANCRVYVAAQRLYLTMVIAAPTATLPMSNAAFHSAFRITAPDKKKSRK